MDERASPAPASAWIYTLLRAFVSGQSAKPPLPQLEPNDWDRVDRLAEAHRITMLMRAAATHFGITLPEDLASIWQDAARDATMDALEQVKRLADTMRLLEEAALKPVALKGAYLAPLAYPQRGWRPTRDIDIWVTPNKARAAFDLLLANGYRRMPGDRADPVLAAQHAHQYPALVTPDGNGFVEIHHRLFYGGEADPSEDGDRFLAEAVMREVAGSAVRFPAPHDMLLHLIRHGAIDNQLASGPSLLADIAYLSKTAEIDWPKFWPRAQAGGLASIAALLLREVQIDAPGMPPETEEEARLVGLLPTLMLPDPDAARLLIVSSGVKANLLATIIPSPTRLQRLGTRFPPSLYPLSLIGHWGRLAFGRLPAAAAMLARPGSRNNAYRSARQRYDAFQKKGANSGNSYS